MALPLDTERLILRPFQEDDWSQVHAYARDLEVVRFMDWGPNSEAETRAFIAQAVAMTGEQPPRSYELAVLFKATGALIGGATLKLDERDPQAAELGYTLHRLAWGQGLGTELARGLVRFGFLQLQVRRIWAKCRPENIASYRVMTKAGLRFVEYVLNDKIVRGQPVDAFLCAITRQEWLSRHPVTAADGQGMDC